MTIGNPKRVAPTSQVDLVDVIRTLRNEIAALQEAATRQLPPGYRVEIGDNGPVIVDTVTGRTATLAWD